jgi:hypothetical protein
MNLSFLDDLFKGIGNVGADADQFMKREMPFDSGWGAPAALVATYFGAPYAMEALGSTGTAGAEGSIGSGGMNSLLSSLGLDGGSGSFAGQEAFQLPMQSYTPDYLNSLANYNGVDAGNPSFLDNLFGNNEQGLYKQEGLAQKASGQTLTDLLKKKQQQSALDQLGKSGSNMQQQNNAQQAEQNRMAQLQAIMRQGQGVDTTTALLSLLKDREQQSKQPRISLI